MVVALSELIDSQELSGGAYTLKYTATGSTDPEAIHDAVLAGTPTIFKLRVRDPDIAIAPVYVDTVTGVGRWDVTVKYSFCPRKMPFDTQAIKIDTAGGTQHVTQAIETSGSYAAAGATAPDFKGAINVTDKTVEGVDIVVPQLNFTVDKCFNLAPASSAGVYNGVGAVPRLIDLYELTGSVNNSNFTVTDSFTGLSITLNPHECLFLGCSVAAARSDGGLEISYSFSASPNKTNIAIGDITVPSKLGWEYLWVHYVSATDTDAKAVVKLPNAAYVVKLYEQKNFAALKLF